MNITKQRAFPTKPNKNIYVPIGLILAVKFLYQINFCDILGKIKVRVLNSIVEPISKLYNIESNNI